MQTITAELDRTIAQLEADLNEAKKAAARIPLMDRDLSALKRTREILAGSSLHRNVVSYTQSDIMEKLGADALSAVENGGLPTSVLMRKILSNANRPMHVDEIMNKLREYGHNTGVPTVVGSLSRDVKAGRLKRTAESTYAAIEAVNTNALH